MSLPSDLNFYLPSTNVASDGGALPSYTVASATRKSVTCADFTTGSFAGAVGFFNDCGTSGTASLAGEFFHVASHDTETGTLYMAKTLSTVPQAGDAVTLFLGGGYRSSQAAFGLLVSGKQPEICPASVAALTGASIVKADPAVGVCDIRLAYDASNGVFKAKREDDGDWGEAVAAPSSDGEIIVYFADATAYIVVAVVAASLPTEDSYGVFTVSAARGVFCPDFEGYETQNGKTRYRLVVGKNETGAAISNLTVTQAVPQGTDTEVSTNGTCNVVANAAGYFTAVDASDWLTKAFWVHNDTKNDCRYVTGRSGNLVNVANPGSGQRGMTAQTWEGGDALSVMPDADIGVEAPSEGAFTDPVSESTAPSGVEFGFYPSGGETAMTTGSVAAGGLVGIWFRETIPAGSRARETVDNSLSIALE